MEVINEKENKLFNRKEIQINIEAEITPSHEQVKKLISEKFSTKPENIRIKKIAGKFGSKVFEIFANIYSSEEDLKKTEVFSKKESEREKKPEQETKQEPSTETSAEKTLKEEQKVSNEIAEEEAVEKKIGEQVEEAKEKIKEETKTE